MCKNWTSKRIVKKIGSYVLSALLIMASIAACPIPDVYADTTTNYLVFTSDVHDKTSDLRSWLQKIPQTPDYVIFGGDYSYSGQTTPQSCANIVSEVFPGVTSILGKGNHDSGSGHAEGLAVNTDNYAIYAVDSTGTGGDVNGNYTTSDLNALETALESIDSDKPVFVIAHHPIHYYGSRTTTNASAMIDLLNDYSNVVFLWGHNHSVSDPNYGTVKFAGDEIQYTSSTSNKKEINFTYANLGCMYTDSNGAYGLFAEIINDGNETTIKFNYKNLSGTTVSTYTLGTAVDPTTPTEKSYELASSIESGAKYVIVARGAADVALTKTTYTSGSTNYLAGQAVTVSGSALVPEGITNDMIWTFTSDGNGYDVVNGGSYLQRPSSGQGSAGLLISGTEGSSSYSDWIYNDSDHKFYIESSGSGNKYNIYLAGDSPYYFSNSKDESSSIYLYKLTEASGNPPVTTVKSYELASTIENGAKYVIVARGDADVALTKTAYTSGSTNYLAGQAVTVSGSALAPEGITNDMIWTFTMDEKGYDVTNGGSYLMRPRGGQGSAGLVISGTEEDSNYSDWIYNNSDHKLYIESSNSGSIYNLYLAGSSPYYFTNSKDESSSIYLYKLTETSDNQPPVVTVKSYELASSIESGAKYVIVARGDADVALTKTTYTSGSTNYLAGQAVTVSGSALVPEGITNDMIWTFTMDEKGYDVTNGGSYLQRPSSGQGSAGLVVSGTEEDSNYSDWIYNDSDHKLYIESSNSGSIYNLYLAGSDPYYFTNSKDESSSIYLYKLTETAIEGYTVEYNGNGSTGGSVPVDNKGYRNGDKVTVLGNTGGLTLSGYTFAGWNTTANGSGTAYSPGSNFTMGTSNVILYAQWNKNSGKKKSRSSKDDNIITPFKDVDEEHWALESIAWAWNKGFMNGISDSLFDPNGKVTRAMFVTVMYRLNGTTESGITIDFHDVARGQWYTDAVAWAAENGIVTGYPDGNFGVNDFITREQISVMIYRYMLKFDDETVDLSRTSIGYNDKEQISDWAKDAIKFCYLTGMMRGKNGFYFDPQGKATRAETAAIIKRISEY